MTPVRLRPRAKVDIAKASRWYGEQRAGLDEAFRDDLETTLRSI